jgi:hypothetical protein
VAGFAVGIVWVVVTLLVSQLSSQVDLLRFPLAWAGVLVALDGLARWRRGLSPLRSPADWPHRVASPDPDVPDPDVPDPDVPDPDEKE